MEERFNKDAFVDHPRFGRGRVRMDDGDTVLVRFDHGVEECLPSDLMLISDVMEQVARGDYRPAINVLARVLGSCILSVNDAWGVFSPSRIALLPHQLWVCKRVLESWPTRWLVADDVGLGKTIEAGLILTPLLSSGRVHRLLILAPASLVDQWQVRLREMFDIRVSIYAPSADTPTSDYWNSHDRLVASAHTLRMDTGKRWERLLAGKAWDLVVVDEAHHLNAHEDRGRTLTFRLVELLQERRRIRSLLFFTGTPHRGKDYGFLSLLKLLRPDEFDPQAGLESQLHHLRNVMIRNNKQRVTDMKGRPVFTPVVSRFETYSYSPEETRFYTMLTDFISTGKAYAAVMNLRQRRMVMLILITMQKLASSSVAAVRRALARRLEMLRTARSAEASSASSMDLIAELIAEDDPSNADEIARLEEELLEQLEKSLGLNPDEIPAIQELLNCADQVLRESKIDRIVEVVDNLFPGRSVLFFTEYKATQALLMNALQERFGAGCVTFINGDGYVEGVHDSDSRSFTFREDRKDAASRFNSGSVRFLVSTEAAGEGIDLQENCCALIHADLPWNPMRLHQRVGRLSRYGQTRPVEVVTIRNPDTVESRIWECLDRKLARITRAFQGAMEDPEDMRQLVIGMASQQVFTDVFAEAPRDMSPEGLETWFNAKTATFGGRDAVEAVRSMIGNVARFDFVDVADQIPRVDLPDLMPFVKAVLAMLGRRPTQIDEIRLSFRTPEEWADDFAIADRYQLLFAREQRPRKDEDIAGIGLRVVNRAVDAAIKTTDALAIVGGLDGLIAVFTLSDRVTGSDGTIRKVVVGMHRKPDGVWNLLRDWELLKTLNEIADRPRSSALHSPKGDVTDLRSILMGAETSLRSRAEDLRLPFQRVATECIACLVPAAGVERP